MTMPSDTTTQSHTSTGRQSTETIMLLKLDVLMFSHNFNTNTCNVY
jgi:hypothetical protein